MDKHTSILAPFDEPTQFRLKLMDSGCEQIVKQEEEAKNKALFAGEEYLPDQQTVAFLEFCKCFGILMNRAIDAGWIDGIQLGEIAAKERDESTN